MTALPKTFTSVLGFVADIVVESLAYTVITRQVAEKVRVTDVLR